MEDRCLKCHSPHRVKNGKAKGQQRYKCKECAYQYTRITPRGFSTKDKTLALILYLSGVSMNMTAQIIGTTAQSVMRWIKEFYEHYKDLPQPQQEIQEIELDEMHHFLAKKKIKFGSGKCYVIAPKNSWAGTVVIAVQRPSNN